MARSQSKNCQASGGPGMAVLKGAFLNVFMPHAGHMHVTLAFPLPPFQRLLALSTKHSVGLPHDEQHFYDPDFGPPDFPGAASFGTTVALNSLPCCTLVVYIVTVVSSGVPSCFPPLRLTVHAALCVCVCLLLCGSVQSTPPRSTMSTAAGWWHKGFACPRTAPWHPGAPPACTRLGPDPPAPTLTPPCWCGGACWTSVAMLPCPGTRVRHPRTPSRVRSGTAG
jgi:hypothetical protein